MAHIVLGSTPEDIEVVLTKDADFFCTIETVDASNWPTGIIIRLIFGSVSYDATVVGSVASFSITDTQVNAIIAARVKTAKLMYIDGTSEICWGIGPVNARG